MVERKSMNDLESLQEKREVIEDALSWALEICLSQDRQRYEVAEAALTELWAAIDPSPTPTETHMAKQWREMCEMHPRAAGFVQVSLSPEMLDMLSKQGVFKSTDSDKR